MITSSTSVARFFRPLRDPRRNHLKKHLLIDIVTITLCAVIADANDWQQVYTFALERRDWLKTFLQLPNGIPSHDTLERVFDRLDPQTFQVCFRRWVESFAQGLGLGHIAIDGKSLRGSANGPKGWKALHLVSAWASECHLCLGQVATEEKSNEITAIPRLLELLDIEGALISIDAMGTQKEIAKRIIDGGGDYILPVKENQPNLADDIRSCFEAALNTDFEGIKHDTCETNETGHGRKEKRSILVVTEPTGIRKIEEWRNLKVIVMCRRDRLVNGKLSEEVHYFIGSREMSAKEYAEALRKHWGIENNMHWQVDVSFGEDDNRVQRRHGAENLALIRRMALGLLKRHPAKLSIANKRYKAGLSTAFLEEILKSDGKLEKP